MKWTNAIGTITAILVVVSGIMTEVLKCTGTDLVNAVCTASWLGDYAKYAALAFGLMALISKSIRPGGLLNSWFGSTAVVVSDGKSAPGVVTKSQVAGQ